MSQSTQQHRHAAPQAVRCAVVTVSDTRTLESDRGGQLLEESLSAAGHTVTRREVVPDAPSRIRALVEELADGTALDAILITGGTGIVVYVILSALAVWVFAVSPGWHLVSLPLVAVLVGAGATFWA